MKLSGDTAIITGGTSGIGKKLAEVMLNEGCRVAICSRSQKHVNTVLGKLKLEYGNNIIGESCDVTRIDELKDFVEYTVSIFGSVRIAVANAGVLPVFGPFEYMSENEASSAAQKTTEINYLGCINTVAAVLPQMKKQSYGRIVTLSGGGDDGLSRNLSLYGASKAAVKVFSKCLSRELRTENEDIKINIFQPGPMKTNLNKKLTLVSGWKDKEVFLNKWNELYETVDLDIEECCSRVIPYVHPECKKKGTVFLGFSLLKILPKLGRIYRLMNTM